MCGIFGFIGHDLERLEGMAASMRMRGPDDVSYYVDDHVSMGMTRLAIVDREHGKQPFYSENNNFVVFYNGEIYNWQELKAMLACHGHVFRTECDGEILPHMFEEYGLDMRHKLDGMFAIAVYDKASKVIHLMRDHAGIKPLYHNDTSFASTTKAMRDSSNYVNDGDWWAWGFPFSKPVWNGIAQVRPMGVVTLRKQQVPVNMMYLFERAVEKRMVADRPIGLFLSGGLDSACVLAQMVRHTDPKQINTFTLCYDTSIPGKDADRASATMLAKHYGTTHHEYVINSDMVWDSLPEIMEAFDQPFAGCISTYFLAQYAKKYVDCVMTGDGADELFGSYLSHRLSIQLKTTPLRDWRFGLCLDHPKNPSCEYDIENIDGRDALDSVLKWEWKTIFRDCVLAFADVLSMAHGLEIRSPFLDKEFSDAAFLVDSSQKVTSDKTKIILRDLAGQMGVPKEIIDRPKEGFVQPSHLWMKTLWQDRIRNLFGDELPDVYYRYIKEDRKEYAQKLWAAICYRIWEKTVCGKT
jgi:asparagine synthase (glutamine-hydrolysing)